MVISPPRSLHSFFCSATALFNEWQDILQEADKAVQELRRDNPRPSSDEALLVTMKDVQILRHFIGKVIEHLKLTEAPPPNVQSSGTRDQKT
jgi:hypothetical protein